MRYKHSHGTIFFLIQSRLYFTYLCDIKIVFGSVDECLYYIILCLSLVVSWYANAPTNDFQGFPKKSITMTRGATQLSRSKYFPETQVQYSIAFVLFLIYFYSNIKVKNLVPLNGILDLVEFAYQCTLAQSNCDRVA